ncbi:HAMP domain-containing protein [Azoarcus sp. L1K30]|uniref:ATP-binding protein n=1 Tax=Azoarcus sp. L1K30 TaxID=2820277 RepID=UPI001B840EBD|nr:ATP-binding protein [Azoarcus sp. L1K30]MBR0565087.1 HAMP domain-containing protein [Azoarcus sp. L1K30]
MPRFWRQLPFPRSLRRQFALALLLQALLIFTGALTAVYALRLSAETSRQLAEERLEQVQQAQNLVETTLLLERESFLILQAETVDIMLPIYANIINQLDQLDLLVAQLGTAGSDLTLLPLHQSGQLFRNSLHVLVKLLEQTLHPGLQSDQREALQQRLHNDHHQLQNTAAGMVKVAHDYSTHISENYRRTIEQQREAATRDQMLILSLLTGSLLLAWLVARFFIGRRVVARLQLVSDYLRAREDGGGPVRIPIHGADEIGEMARAAEQLLDNRRQLARAFGELKTAQARLLQQEKMASIGQLAAGVAHEINNPMGFILSNLNTLEKYLGDLIQYQQHLMQYQQLQQQALEHTTPSDDKALAIALAELGRRRQQLGIDFLQEDVSDLIRESIEGGQRIKAIVHKLNAFAHPDEQRWEEADINAALDGSLNVVGNDVRTKAEITRDYGDIPPVWCNISQLNQVFINLLINAAQAISGHGEIRIATRRTGDEIRIDFADSGCGIPSDELPRIFEPFYTTKEVGKGTGLGLSTAYDIVHQHGGKIEVASEVGRGTTFTIHVPLRRA